MNTVGERGERGWHRPQVGQQPREWASAPRTPTHPQAPINISHPPPDRWPGRELYGGVYNGGEGERKEGSKRGEGGRSGGDERCVRNGIRNLQTPATHVPPTTRSVA